MATQADEHGHYVLLVQASGVKGGDAELDRLAQLVHDAYMQEFRGRGAITMALHRLERVVRTGTNAKNQAEWTHLVSYFGPANSVTWLQSELERVAESNGATVTTMTFDARDITGRY
jgi:hypothetical protein